MERNISVITEADGKKFVLINDIRFRGKYKKDWQVIEKYLKEYIGEFYEIEETSDKIFISTDFPEEYANSESRIMLKGALARAKANAESGIKYLYDIVTIKKETSSPL